MGLMDGADYVTRYNGTFPGVRPLKSYRKADLIKMGYPTKFIEVVDWERIAKAQPPLPDTEVGND